MTTSAIPVICSVIGCDERGTGRYLDVRKEPAREFHVCSRHFTRIEQGELPRVVTARLDLAALDGPLALTMDPL